MMNLQKRIKLLVDLGNFLQQNNNDWQQTKLKAEQTNGWFTTEFIDLACNNICHQFLQETILTDFSAKYRIPPQNHHPKKVGIVMAGNIPLVGFHDFLCVFLSGNIAVIKLSSKDNVLLKFLVEKMVEWDEAVADYISFSEMLKGCDAYIATGSNNSARYFDYYFQKYPSIIRKNRTSVAVIDGEETTEELEKLADDMHLYFGLGCRNVTFLYVPENYDFVPLINAMKKYSYFIDHNKYKNNFDYQLALHLLNNKFYMTNGATLLVENSAHFSAISQVHYGSYKDKQALIEQLSHNPDIQCLVSHQHTGFGMAQTPTIYDFADGVDTMQFLLSQ